tara:strand:- start:909 stop:1070 length:162 start_codon:yes stop_codon:yes gene_type:complete
MNISQLVQDVLYGKESAIKALTVLTEEKLFIERCIERVSEMAKKELNDKNETK